MSTLKDNATPDGPPRILTDKIREDLVLYLADAMKDTMFGDGLERDYILDGFPVWGGLRNMADRELLIEFINVAGEDVDVSVNEESTDDELLAAWVAFCGEDAIPTDGEV